MNIKHLKLLLNSIYGTNETTPKIIEILNASGISKTDIITIFKSDKHDCSQCKLKPACELHRELTCLDHVNTFLNYHAFYFDNTPTILMVLGLENMFVESVTDKNKYINISGIQTQYKRGDILKSFVDYETFIVYSFLESCNAYILEDKKGNKIAVTQDYIDFNLYKLEVKEDE